MKRYFWYLSAILIVTMLVFNTASYGNSAPQNSSYEQNFDSVNAGGFENLADPLWSAREPNSGDEANISYVISTEQSKTAPNSLKIVDSSSLSAAIVRMAFPEMVGSGYYKVSVFLPTEGTEESCYLTLANGSSSSNRYVDILFTGKGELRYRTASDFTTVMKFERNKWYDIEVTWANDTFNLSVDGVAVVTNAAVVNPANIPTLLEFKAGSNNKKSFFYIDDLTLNFK